MEPGFWIDRWREGKIGFHEGQPNAHLVRFAGQLGAARRVLVPLCGKTVDLAYLAAQGHDVVGVELVEDAARAFFAEQGITPTVAAHGPFVAYAAPGLTILIGDMFATTAPWLGAVDALYDRAALIALPPALRARYVAHLRALLPAGAPGLLVTLDYPQDRMPGPPFAVADAEVRAHYDRLAVALLAETPAAGGRLQELGLAAVERVYRVTF